MSKLLSFAPEPHENSFVDEAMSETFEPRPDYVIEQPRVEVVYAEVEPSAVMSIRKE